MLSSAQIKQDAEGDTLIGNVKKIEEYRYNFNRFRKRNDTPFSTAIYAYDEKLNQATVFYYGFTIWVDKVVWSYDDNSHLTAQEWYGNDHLNLKTTYKYDQDGKLAESQQTNNYMTSGVYRGDDTVDCKYDFGRKMVKFYCRPSRNPNYPSERDTTIYIYDSTGHILSENTYKNGALSSETIFSYDDEHHQIVRQLKQAGEHKSKTVLSYDDRMHLIKEVHYTEHTNFKRKFRKVRSISRYEYKYDERGNWTERLSFRNRKKQVYTKRKILYEGTSS